VVEETPGTWRFRSGDEVFGMPLFPRAASAYAEVVADVAGFGARAKYEAAGMRFSGIAVDPDPVALRGLVALVEPDRLRVHVQETFPFERVVDAHRLLGGGHLHGKLVLTV